MVSGAQFRVFQRRHHTTWRLPTHLLHLLRQSILTLLGAIFYCNSHLNLLLPVLRRQTLPPDWSVLGLPKNLIHNAPRPVACDKDILFHVESHSLPQPTPSYPILPTSS